MPLTILERATGQYYRKPLPEIYAIHHLKYIGNAFVIIIVFVIMGYFHLFLTIYCLIYVIDAMVNNMEWLYGERDTLRNNLRVHFQNETLELDRRGSGFFDFNTKVTPLYILMWIIIYYSIREGIRTNNPLKVFLVVSIYGALILILIYVLALPGSINGIIYLVVPTFDKIFSMQTWKEALDQNYFQGILEHTQYLANAIFKLKSAMVFRSTLT